MSPQPFIKPPPLLLGAALVFWGWQSGFLIIGVGMGLALEGVRLVRNRWEFSNDDFQRIWTFCALVLLASLVYAFNTNDGPADFRGLFQNPSYYNQRNAGAASARTAASVIRWLPMIFFPFVAMQAYSTRDSIPLETISLILRRRWRKASESGEPRALGQDLNVSYFYFGLCLFASCIHTDDGSPFFWGLAILLGWGLWPLRSRRYGLFAWGGSMLLAIGLGYWAQLGVGRLTQYIEGFNSQLLSRLARGRFDHAQSRTEMGRIGRLKASNKILLRLNTQAGLGPPPLLREASYRTFKGITWLSEISQGAFENIPNPSDTNQTTWVLVPGKETYNSVEIACYLPGGNGLLPLPSGVGRLENLGAYLLQKNSLGSVMAQGPGLVIFDALYDPGPTLDSPPNPVDDLDFPGRERYALERAVVEMGLTDGHSPEEIRQGIAQFFASKFTYSLWQERSRRTREEETALEHFLFTSRSGHCEYFATATTLLLRRLGIPARYAVGYAVHEESGNDQYVVRSKDAHAWCLVWNQATGIWEDFDTTPGSWIEIESSRPPAYQFLTDIWSRIRFEFSKVRWGQTQLRQYVIWGLIPVLAVLLYRIIFRSRARKRRGLGKAGRREDWPGLDSEFYQLEKRVGQHGVVREPGEPLSIWLSRAVSDPALAEINMPLQRVLALHYRYRFDPLGLTGSERSELRDQVRVCLARLESVNTG